MEALVEERQELTRQLEIATEAILERIENQPQPAEAVLNAARLHLAGQNIPEGALMAALSELLLSGRARLTAGFRIGTSEPQTV